MPWTTKKYPAAMKKLPAAVRAKAIQIGNAILKEKKKVKESVIVATAIKKAKQLAGKATVKKAAPKKRVTVKAKQRLKLKNPQRVKQSEQLLKRQLVRLLKRQRGQLPGKPGQQPEGNRLPQREASN